MSRVWFKNWEANAPAPATTVRPKTTTAAAAAVVDNTRRVSFSGLCANVHVFDKGVRVKVILEEPIAIPFGEDSDIDLAAGAELEVTKFHQVPEPLKFGNLDRIRVVGCYATPSSKTPGAQYINCQDFQLVQRCWDLDDLYLARQSLEGKFIVTSRTVKCEADKSNPQDGLFSQMVWPKDASLVTKDGREILLLHFRLQYAPWTADQVLLNNDEPPAAMTFCLKMWQQHCVQMMPGPVPMEAWKELMARGTNPIPFVALVSIKQGGEPNGWSNGGDQELQIHVLHVDFASYVTSPACPVVSRDLVKAHTTAAAATNKKAGKTGAGAAAIVNVSATGLTKDAGGPFPTFRAMTSAPDELTNETAIREALEAGTVSAVQFFAVPDSGGETKEAPNKKQRK